MCGIGGIVNLDATIPISGGTLACMGRAMLHRGPDANGVYLGDGVGFVHQRLKIIDLVAGHQPMYSADEQIALVFNGEIYNYQSIRRQLENRGFRFRTQSDTEVILEAYRAFGVNCLDHLQGMFAFAIHDRPANTVLLARDRLGIKPLYYSCSNGKLLFASEVRALLAASDVRPGVNEGALGFYLELGYVPLNETLFKDIRKLPAGHQLVIKDGGFHISEYWDLKNGPTTPYGSLREAKDGLRDVLQDTVRDHLISDVPSGAFLSGGLDSSAVVAMMANCTTTQVQTFSVGYTDDNTSNELGFAKQVAKRFNTKHHEFVLESGEFFSSLEEMVRHSEEPIVEAASIALLAIARLAKQHATVVLSGEGADEVLSGYTSYRRMQWVDRLSLIGKYLPTSARSWIASGLRGNEKLAKYWEWCTAPGGARYHGVSADMSAGTKSRLFSDQLSATVGDSVEQFFHTLHQRCSNASRLQQMMYADIKGWLVDDLLLKADKMTMAASVELRVPFLDHRLAEFCWRLPDEYRVRRGEGKFLLKELMLDYLPREIVYRKKRGFPVPIAHWFSGPLFQQVEDILLDRDTINRGYFNQNYVKQILEEHRATRFDHSRRILSLLVLELWHRQFIDTRLAVAA